VGHNTQSSQSVKTKYTKKERQSSSYISRHIATQRSRPRFILSHTTRSTATSCTMHRAYALRRGHSVNIQTSKGHSDGISITESTRYMSAFLKINKNNRSLHRLRMKKSAHCFEAKTPSDSLEGAGGEVLVHSNSRIMYRQTMAMATPRGQCIWSVWSQRHSITQSAIRHRKAILKPEAPSPPAGAAGPPPAN